MRDERIGWEWKTLERMERGREVLQAHPIIMSDIFKITKGKKDFFCYQCVKSMLYNICYSICLKMKLTWQRGRKGVILNCGTLYWVVLWKRLNRVQAPLTQCAAPRENVGLLRIETYLLLSTRIVAATYTLRRLCVSSGIYTMLSMHKMQYAHGQ